MLFFYKFTKRSKKTKHDAGIHVPPEEQENQTRIGLETLPHIGLSGRDEDEALNGIEIKTFAKKNRLSVEQVWQKIKSGLLIARTQNGFVYVYGNIQTSLLPAPRHQTDDHQVVKGLPLNLPPVPVDIHSLAKYEADGFNSGLAPQVAMLVDQLFDAKEENKRILQFSENSMMQINTLSQKIISSKDDLISENQNTIEQYKIKIDKFKQRLAEQKRLNSELKQNLEDYEILTRALSPEDP